MDWKLELVAVPVSDVERAKSFYTEKIGFVADHDHRVRDDLRFVHFDATGLGVLDRDGRGDRDVDPGVSTGPSTRGPGRRGRPRPAAGTGCGGERRRGIPVGLVRLLPGPRRKRLGREQIPARA